MSLVRSVGHISCNRNLPVYVNHCRSGNTSLRLSCSHIPYAILFGPRYHSKLIANIEEQTDAYSASLSGREFQGMFGSFRLSNYRNICLCWFLSTLDCFRNMFGETIRSMFGSNHKSKVPLYVRFALYIRIQRQQIHACVSIVFQTSFINDHSGPAAHVTTRPICAEQ